MGVSFIKLDQECSYSYIIGEFSHAATRCHYNTLNEVWPVYIDIIFTRCRQCNPQRKKETCLFWAGRTQRKELYNILTAGAHIRICMYSHYEPQSKCIHTNLATEIALTWTSLCGLDTSGMMIGPDQDSHDGGHLNYVYGRRLWVLMK